MELVVAFLLGLYLLVRNESKTVQQITGVILIILAVVGVGVSRFINIT